MSCRRARQAILASARHQASEAERLDLERHLGDCDRCRAERARWGLLETLREYEPPPLARAGRLRVLQQLRDLRPDELPPPPRAAPRRPIRVAAAGLLILLSLGATVAGVEPWPTEFRGADGVQVIAQRSDHLHVAGASIALAAGSAVRLFPSQRRLLLEGGALDVEVSPGGRGRFQVATTRFTVEVLGTRFLVDGRGVRTLHGRVRILDPHGVELAIVHAGERWSAPAATVAASPHRASAILAPPVAAAAPARPVAVATAAARPIDVEAHLAAARAELAARHGQAGREILRRLPLTALSPRQRPVYELLGADALLVEARRGEAIQAYRRVARRFPDLPEGEAAAFAVAQVLVEARRSVDAEAALHGYLARYPEGRFAREVREQIAELRPQGP